MRRRKPLQPDTFPFLAVLLGTMGSLILILMIFDQRARKAANEKSRQAEAEQQKLHHDDQEQHFLDNEAERKARLAAFVQKQSEIRTLETQLQEQQISVSHKIGETQRKIAEDEQRRQQTEAQLRAEQQRLQQALREAQERQQNLTQNSTASKQTQSQIQKLAADLAQAEEALKRLLEQKLRDEQTWSIVPYVGKRGQNQRPLYVECDSRGFTFYPDKFTLFGIDAMSNRVREEIEARTKQARNDRPGRDVYWMLLVRPDGIENYYRFQGATQGLSVAFGYELIDAEWALEFPEPPNDPVTVPPQSPRPVRVASDNAMSQGSGGGTGHLGSAATVLPPRASGEGGSGIPTLIPRPPGTGGTGVSGGQPGGSHGGGGPGGSSSNPGSPRTGTGEPLPRPGGGGHQVVPTLLPRPQGIGGTGATRGESGTAPQGSGIGSTGGAPGTGTRTGESTSQGGEPAPPPRPGGSVPQGAQDGSSAPGTGTGEPTGQGGEPAPPPGPGGSVPQGGQGGQRPRNGKQGQPSSGRPQGAGAEGEPGSGEKGGSIDGLPGPKKPKILKPARVGPEPDWIIEVVCQASGVSVPGGRMQYSAAELNNGNVLAERIGRWIADRQATLRPGEPPYRPQIHFIVHPEGQRTFHLVYPALERLQVPMRTVLHQDDGE